VNRGRILVVDDHPQNRMVAVGHLEHAGYEVVAVGSGEDALLYIAVHRPDLVVLDVLMPGIGGFETCRRIRAMPGIHDTPVLFLTPPRACPSGSRTPARAPSCRAPAIEAGGDDVIAKPFNRAELLLRVSSLIRQRRTADELREAARLLATQNDQLRKLEADKRRISQLIVHDLRGPAGAIMGNAEMLREAKLPGELGEFVDDIVLAVEQLDQTVRDLLDLARAEDIGLEVNRETLDLPALANDVASALRGYGRWSGVRRCSGCSHCSFD
jgi:CheY-like chemotaxis protein